MSKTVSVALKAHLAAEVATLATCWKVTRVDATVLGFTDHDTDLVVSGVTYAATSGYSRTDVATSNALNVDNLEVAGVLQSPAITEEDLRAGLWDYAAVEVFLVNYADLTQGTLALRKGRLGEVTLERNTFKAELRGMMQAYQRTVGELYSPGCRAVLGDTRCTVNLAALTVTGSIDAVHADGVTLYDAARTEPGPNAGTAILDVVLGNPTRIDFSGTSNVFTDGEPVMVRGIVGPTALNVLCVVQDFNGANIFYVNTDSTSFPAYVSGGTVYRYPNTGYFDGGLITMTSGANAGLAMEVKAYAPGQWTLQLPFPYTVAPGDTYSMSPGCDKSLATCRDTFNNVVNFRGEPFLPGLDKTLQTGRH